jgi:hypothetical protein
MQAYVAGDTCRGMCGPVTRLCGCRPTPWLRRARTDGAPELWLCGGSGPLRDHPDPPRPVWRATTWSSSRCCWRTTRWSWRWAPATSPFPCTFRSPTTTHRRQPERRAPPAMRDVFDLPDLTAMDDGIANGTHVEPRRGEAQPLSSVHRARGWTIRCSAAPLHRHLAGAFSELCAVHQLPVLHRRVRCAWAMPPWQDPASEYIAFVEPGNVVTRRLGLDRRGR